MLTTHKQLSTSNRNDLVAHANTREAQKYAGEGEGVNHAKTLGIIERLSQSVSQSVSH